MILRLAIGTTICDNSVSVNHALGALPLWPDLVHRVVTSKQIMANWYDVVERARRHEEQNNEQEPCDDLLVMLFDGRGHPCHDASLDDMQVITVGPHTVPGPALSTTTLASYH